MLTIVYGDAENSIYNTSVYFKNSYESEWFDSESGEGDSQRCRSFGCVEW